MGWGVSAPRLVVVGHCTTTTARILCCAEAGERVARVTWRAGGATGVVEKALAPASPYSLGVADLVGLPAGAEVDYSIDIGGQSAAGRFRLMPAHRPPRIALLSCNGAFEVEDPERRYRMWQRLHAEVQAGNVDLVVHAGDQVYADDVVKRHTSTVRRAKDTDAV